MTKIVRYRNEETGDEFMVTYGTKRAEVRANMFRTVEDLDEIEKIINKLKAKGYNEISNGQAGTGDSSGGE